MNRQIDAYSLAYRLATAIYIVAQHEAAGSLGHHAGKNDQELREIQQDAYDFCLEWREFFAQRLRHKDDVAPLPAPPELKPKPARGGRKKSGQPSTIERMITFLADHGPSTASEIADGADCSYDNACKMLKTHPGLFRIVGERRNGPVVSTLWDVKGPSKAFNHDH